MSLQSINIFEIPWKAAWLKLTDLRKWNSELHKH